ncbi:hypothetical protein NXS19_004447 [Fusarium pseudograminearum]|nr:hypothetical protein NXS19_004447 [Fusarium pseudograminearum]
MAQVFSSSMGACPDFAMLTPSDSPSESPFYPDTPPLSSSPSETDLSLNSAASASEITPETTPVVAVVGVGYVGTHLVSSFSSKYQVIGFDVSERRIKELDQEFQGNNHVRFSRTQSDLISATHFLISVPTLLRPNKSINSSYLRDALNMVSQVARRGSTIVIESSVAAYLRGMSPERVDPGRTFPPVKSIPKIISGLDDILPGSLDTIYRLYSTIFDNVVKVSKPEVAEMMKLYENCQRMVCIAYANEMADACIPHGIDPYEQIPFAGSLFHGHEQPPSKLAQRLIASLPSTGKRSRVLVVGLGFKAGQSQLDNSPGVDLVRSLAISGSDLDLTWADALVKQEAVPQVSRLADQDWTKSFWKLLT